MSAKEKKLTRRWARIAAVVGTNLYIDGGSLSLGLNVTNPTMDIYQNSLPPRFDTPTHANSISSGSAYSRKKIDNRLLTVDLSKKFTAGNHSVGSYEKPDSEPTFNDGIMFSSGNNLVTYGGFYPSWNTSAPGARQPSSSVSATRSFDISSGQWGAINNDVPGLAVGAGVSAPGTGRAWYLGGAQDNRTTQGLDGLLAVNGMLDFSVTPPKNLTTSFGGVLGAMIAYLPAVGKEGILVKIGGGNYAAGAVDSEHSMVLPLIPPSSPHSRGGLSMTKIRSPWNRLTSTTSRPGLGTLKTPPATPRKQTKTQTATLYLACWAAPWQSPRPTTQATRFTCTAVLGSSTVNRSTMSGCSRSPCSGGRKRTRPASGSLGILATWSGTISTCWC